MLEQNILIYYNKIKKGVLSSLKPITFSELLDYKRKNIYRKDKFYI